MAWQRGLSSVLAGCRCECEYVCGASRHMRTKTVFPVAFRLSLLRAIRKTFSKLLNNHCCRIKQQCGLASSASEFDPRYPHRHRSSEGIICLQQSEHGFQPMSPLCFFYILAVNQFTVLQAYVCGRCLIPLPLSTLPEDQLLTSLATSLRTS